MHGGGFLAPAHQASDMDDMVNIDDISATQYVNYVANSAEIHNNSRFVALILTAMPDNSESKVEKDIAYLFSNAAIRSSHEKSRCSESMRISIGLGKRLH